MLDVRFSTAERSIIKIIGVGGAGGNAVNLMFERGLKDVFFAVCNTDYQDLDRSPVPCKIQLGENLTAGLGCGADAGKGRAAALESAEQLDALFQDKCMIFVTAGMGGGTGTGAAPVIARMARDKGLLTVGIVTLPFRFELSAKIEGAMKGLNAMAEAVDSLIVLNTQKLGEAYGSLPLSEAFNKANEMILAAARGITDIVSRPGYVNVDFADVEAILRGGGVAIVNTGEASGSDRVSTALHNAFSMPLLKGRKITDAKRILFYILTSKKHEVTISELEGINNFINDLNRERQVIWGQAMTDDDSDKCSVTIIATGFDLDDVCDKQLYDSSISAVGDSLADFSLIDEPSYKKRKTNPTT